MKLQMCMYNFTEFVVSFYFAILYMYIPEIRQSHI